MKKQIILAAGGLVFNPEGKLLLIYRKGFWDLPKGKLDAGETLEQCAVREVKEETGLRNIILGSFIGTTHHEYFDKWIKEEVIKESHWFEMKIETQQILVPQTEEDIEDIKWVNLREMDKYLADSYESIVVIIATWKNKNGID